MKKLLLSAWLMMLSIAAMAQTIIVEGKDGSVTPYDTKQVSSVEFQASPPGFTVNQEGKSDKYEFANVKGIATSPDGITYTLTCTNSPTQIHADNEGSLTFMLTQSWSFLGETSTLPISDYGIEQNSDEFTTKVSSSLPRTNKDGKAYVTFMAKDIVNLTSGTVTATCKVDGMTLTAQGTVMGLDWTYELRCINSPQYIDADGNAAVTFELWGKGTDQWGKSEMYEIPNATVHFTCTEGTCDETATTDFQGRVTVNFKTDDPENFKKSIITATSEFRGKNATQAEGIVYGLPTYTLTCTDSPQEIEASGDAYLTFNLTATIGEETRPVKGATLNFSATNGKWDYTAHGSQTQEDGNIEMKFYVEETDLLEFTEGSLTATFEKDGKTYTATGQVTGNLEWTLELNPVPSEKQIYSDGTTNGAFTLTATVTDKEGGESQFLIPGITVNCTTTSGTCTPFAVAGEDEEFADFVFQTDDILNFEGATVTGTCEYKGKTYEGKAKVLPLDWEYILTCKNSGQTIDKEGKATLQFQLKATTTAKVAGTATTDIIVMVVPKATVSFAASEGSCSPVSGVTDEAGMVEVVFQASDPKTFEEGTVTATYVKGAKITTGEGEVKGDPEQGGDDVFDKAKKLNDNVYIVRDNAGNESTRGLLQDWSQWNRGKAGCDSQTRVIKISLEDGKVDQESGSVETQGGGYFEIPIDQFGEPMQLLLDYIATYGTLQGSFFTFKKPDEGYSSSNYLSLKFGCGDMHNLKSGTVQLQKKSSSANASAMAPRRALEEDYSGELEFVFAFTFTNYIYDNESGEEIEDGEYTVYGKAVVNEFTPKITYFKLEPESGFVGIGKSVEVNVKEYTDEDAVWDWNDVELVASYVNYANYETDEGYFSWNPATHSLTSLKSNNNESVYVRFRLKSNPELTSYFTIRTGDGWPYTAFTISPAEQTVEHGYNCQFNVESWEPAGIAWDPYAIEIDPATNPGTYHKYFIYEPSFPRFRCSYAAEAGTYDVRMRLMSDHSVGFTIRVTVTAEE